MTALLITSLITSLFLNIRLTYLAIAQNWDILIYERAVSIVGRQGDTDSRRSSSAWPGILFHWFVLALQIAWLIWLIIR